RDDALAAFGSTRGEGSTPLLGVGAGSMAGAGFSAKQFTGSSPIASSLPMARYQSRSARAAFSCSGPVKVLSACRESSHLPAPGAPESGLCRDDADISNPPASGAQPDWPEPNGDETLDDVIERETMEFDVVIVGAGPAGLAAAIRLKQLAAETGNEVSVVVLEKGSQVGAHILSGAVIDPVALDRLLPDWREQDSPLQTQVSEDRFYYLTEKGGIGFPYFLMPPLMSNHGCYTGSLGSLCRWLGEQAEALGVEIYAGISVTDAIFGPNGEVEGVITGDMGVARDGTHKDSYTPGIALTGKYTLLAEGARGSLTKQLIRRLSLDAESGPQKYGIGLKELWEVPKEKHRPGLVQHTMGWPLGDSTGGGSFLYHFGDNLVSVGFVVHLDYANPYLNPFKEFQRA